MTTWRKHSNHGSRFAEELVSDVAGQTYGYRLIGAGAGPSLVVAGLCPVVDAVFDRLLSIPTLPWMRGTLILLRLDALPTGPDDVAALDNLGPVDRTLTLPWPGPGASADDLNRTSCRMILRACGRLGMIAGRGVR